MKSVDNNFVRQSVTSPPLPPRRKKSDRARGQWLSSDASLRLISFRRGRKVMLGWMDGWMGGCITRPPAAKSSKSGTLSLSSNISQSWKTISNYRCWFSVNIKETPGDCSEEELLWFVALSNLLFASSHCLVVAILPRVLLHSDTIPACGLFQIASLSCIAFCHHHPCLAAHQWSDASLLEYNRLP